MNHNGIDDAQGKIEQMQDMSRQYDADIQRIESMKSFVHRFLKDLKISKHASDRIIFHVERILNEERVRLRVLFENRFSEF